MKLEANRVSARNHAEMAQNIANAQAYKIEEIGAVNPELPAISIPPFSGKPLSPLLKFNYLLSALLGGARECLRRFTVTAANYDHAVAFLQAKYADESRLIDCLQSRLEKARAQQLTLEGQRSLLEYILPTVTQLKERGVSLDGSFMVQKVLSKFRPDLQRKVLQRRLSNPLTENEWIMTNILSDLDRVIETEEPRPVPEKGANNATGKNTIIPSVIESLKNDPALLDAYDKTFKEQKEEGIIEEVSEKNCANSTVVHYIPHQPVVPPHKETTKLRIVFDASAHFKDKPSLSDVLQQGPLILPDLYAMLLRFRTPRYVVISDVEKRYFTKFDYKK
ncbi:hypothetical protein ANCCEY_13526 [Ancylostoma ceylanicum]|uniref:Uncharacterized protein n=1 Tax=Ancylostoma ceylanicum TaxID=53326 RepID=A0A0D6LID7_9BILA|nr:hypothetical protein ANCCEY_13526 [Ancylostoma ceylanicum]